MWTPPALERFCRRRRRSDHSQETAQEQRVEAEAISALLYVASRVAVLLFSSLAGHGDRQQDKAYSSRPSSLQFLRIHLEESVVWLQTQSSSNHNLRTMQEDQLCSSD